MIYEFKSIKTEEIGSLTLKWDKKLPNVPNLDLEEYPEGNYMGQQVKPLATVE